MTPQPRNGSKTSSSVIRRRTSFAGILVLVTAVAPLCIALAAASTAQGGFDFVPAARPPAERDPLRGASPVVDVVSRDSSAAEQDAAGTPLPADEASDAKEKKTEAPPARQGSRLVPLGVAVVLVLFYAAGILFVRVFFVVRPNDLNLRGEIARVRARLVVDQQTPTQQTELERIVGEEIERILQGAERLCEGGEDDVAVAAAPAKKPKHRSCPFYYLRSAGSQNAAWRRIHEAQCLTVDILADDVVETQASYACADLPRLKSKSADAIAESLKQELAKGAQIDRKRLRALLKEASQLLYERRDGTFEMLWEWNNKGLWLTTAAALLVLCLAGLGNGQLLLLGAVGGLLSKLRGIVKRRSVPYDYGVSWTTLFLTPLVGALTGWVGVLLVPLFLQLGLLGEFFKLGEFFQLEPVSGSADPKALAIALFFGLGATYFDQLLESAQKPSEAKPSEGASESA